MSLKAATLLVFSEAWPLAGIVSFNVSFDKWSFRLFYSQGCMPLCNQLWSFLEHMNATFLLFTLQSFSLSSPFILVTCSSMEWGYFMNCQAL